MRYSALAILGVLGMTACFKGGHKRPEPKPNDESLHFAEPVLSDAARETHSYVPQPFKPVVDPPDPAQISDGFPLPAFERSLLGGPWDVPREASSPFVRSQLLILGNIGAKTIESVWVKVWAPVNGAGEPQKWRTQLVLQPFFSAVKLLDAQPDQDGVFLYLETLKAFNQPEGLRSVVLVKGNVVVPTSKVPGVVSEPFPIAFTPVASNWQDSIPSSSLDGKALFELTKFSRAEQLAPDGLNVQSRWQGGFLERVERITSKDLFSHPVGRALVEKTKTMHEELEQNESACEQASPSDLAFPMECKGLRLAVNNGQLTVTDIVQPAQPTLSAPNVATNEASHVLTAAEATELDAQVARLPVKGIELLRGRWQSRIPFALLKTGATSSRLLWVFAAPLRTTVWLDSVDEALSVLKTDHIQARLWENAAPKGDKLLLHVGVGKSAWLGLFSFEPLKSVPASLNANQELTFWAHGARTLDEAIEKLRVVPTRGVEAKDALALLAASKTVKGFRANSTKQAEVFEMAGWWNTGGQVIARKNARSGNKITDKDVSSLPDPTIEQAFTEACCHEFTCREETPNCYCYSHGCGLSDQFWFAWENGALKIAGVGKPTK